MKDHKDQIVVSWCDDGVTLMCKREECMEMQEMVSGYERPFYWQRLYDGQSPEGLVKMRDKHLRGETIQ